MLTNSKEEIHNGVLFLSWIARDFTSKSSLKLSRIFREVIRTPGEKLLSSKDSYGEFIFNTHDQEFFVSQVSSKRLLPDR